jgi:hypothetical protein
MGKRLTLIAVALCVTEGIAYAQYPIPDMVADRVVQKYQSSTCEQLWQRGSSAKTVGEPGLG